MNRHPLLIVCLGCLLLLSPAFGSDAEMRALFNGQDLSNWDTYLGPPFPGHEDAAKGATPDNVFSVVEQDGRKLIRISGVMHGSLATKETFGNYHLRLVYKWGTEVTRDRNSGLLYHSYGPPGTAFGAWMASIECQMMHGNAGDAFLMVDEVACTAEAVQAMQDYVFKPGAKPVPFGEFVKRRMIHHSADAEKPLGEWNTIDLYCLGQTAVYVVNGRTVNRIEKIGIQHDGKIEPLTRGKIQLQSEGAELFVQSVAIEPITEIPAEASPSANAEPTAAMARPLETEFVYEAIVSIGQAVDVGSTPRGHRRYIPITGGTFEGPRLRGTLLAGGADWQTERPDGVTEVDALYSMRCEDGTVIIVHNAGVIAAGGAYIRTAPRFESPDGPHAWLNQAQFVGSVAGGPRPGTVTIRVFRVL